MEQRMEKYLKIVSASSLLLQILDSDKQVRAATFT